MIRRLANSLMINKSLCSSEQPHVDLQHALGGNALETDSTNLKDR